MQEMLTTSKIYQIMLFAFQFILILNQVKGQSTDQIYNPLPYQTFNTTMYGKNLIQIQFINSKPDLIFLSFQDEGLFIIDYSSFEVIAQKKLSLSTVLLKDFVIFALTLDQGIMMLSFNQYQKTIILNGIFNPLAYKINTIAFSLDEKYILVAQDCILRVFLIKEYAFSDLSQKQLVDNEFLLEKGFTGEVCLKNSNHIFVSEKISIITTIKESIGFFDTSNIESPQYIRSFKKVATDVQMCYLMKSNQFLITLSKYYDVNIIWLGDVLGVNNVAFQSYPESAFAAIPLTQTGGSKTYNYMLVDNEEKFLFLGIRTNGISVYDLTPLKSMKIPTIVQSLDTNGLSDWIAFAPPKNDERKQYQFLFLSDGTGIEVFEKVEANLNSNIVNLYNSDLCVLINFSSDDWPWSMVTYSDSNNYLAISAGGDGLVTFDLRFSGQAVEMERFKRYSVSHDGILYLPKSKIIVLGQSGEGMSFYNATDPENLVYINEFKLKDNQNDCDDISADETEKYLGCANGFQGFYILNINDIQNPVVHSKVDLTLKKNGVESIIFDNELKFGFYAIREEGVGYFRLTENGTVITLVSFFPTLGAEYLRFDISSPKQNFVFVADGYQGLTIIDCSDYMKPFIRSQVPVQGWAIKFTQLVANPSTIIVSQMEKGQISIIDISSIDKGIKISALQYGSESAFGIASHPYNKFIVFTLQKSFRLCTTANPLAIHTQVKRLDSVNPSIYYPYIAAGTNSSSKDRIFIGESVDLIITSFQYPRKIRFDKINYYMNYQLNELPPWIQFIQYLSTIRIVANLDAINTNKGFNILLIDIKIPIKQTDFGMRVGSQKPITLISSKQSALIYNKLIEVGLLGIDGFVTDFYNSNMKLELDWYSSDEERQLYENSVYINDIKQSISRILSRATFSYPIQFLAEGSLKFNQIDNSSRIYVPLIQTFSPIISVVFTILDSKIQFVKQKQDGIIYQYLEQNSIFSISGEIKVVNDFISSKMVISHPLQQPPSVLQNFRIMINITDSINNPLIQTYDIKLLPFIRNKKAITLTTTFQQQYDQQYSKGLTANDRFAFILDTTAIQIDADLTFTLSVCMQQGGEWVDINKIRGFWMSFEETQIRGLPPISSFNNQYNLKIIINDGYTSLDSMLKIKISIFPPEQIIMIIIILISVFIILLGIYIFRRKLHFIFLQKFHTFSSEIFLTNELFNKKIVYAPKIYSDVLKLFFQLQASFYNQNQVIGDDQKQANIDQFISNYRNSDTTISYEELFKDAYQIYSQNPSKYPNLHEGEFKSSDTRVKISLKSYLAKFILYNDPQMLKIYKRLKEYTQQQYEHTYVDWYKNYIDEYINFNQLSKNQSITLSKDQTSLNDSENRVVFGQLEIKVLELQNALEQIFDQSEMNVEYNFYNLTEVLKADYYGFDYKNQPNTWKSSVGEVIHSKMNKINPFEVYRKIEQEGDKNSIKNRITQFFMMNYKWIGSYKKHLPEWLGYEIVDNVLILSGVPKKQNQGEYKIVVYNQDGYAAQSINILIKQRNKKVQGEKNYQNDTPHRKKISDYLSGNNLNGSIFMNNNLPSLGTEKIIPQQTLSANLNTSFNKLNTKPNLGTIAKLNTEEIKDQKRSFFAFEAGQINYSPHQDGESKGEFPKEAESQNSINSNHLKENGVIDTNINYFTEINGKRKQPTILSSIPNNLFSPPFSAASTQKEHITPINSQTNLKMNRKNGNLSEKNISKI